MSISKQFACVEKSAKGQKEASVPTSRISRIAEERSVARLPRDQAASERPAVRRLPRAAFLQPRKSAQTQDLLINSYSNITKNSKNCLLF